MFISTEKRMWDNGMQDWLRLPDIFNLELTAISNRHNHQKIKDFLYDGRLADDCDDNAGIPGIRLRIDLCCATELVTISVVIVQMIGL
jgi:hypothetical protein